MWDIRRTIKIQHEHQYHLLVWISIWSYKLLQLYNDYSILYPVNVNGSCTHQGIWHKLLGRNDTLSEKFSDMEFQIVIHIKRQYWCTTNLHQWEFKRNLPTSLYNFVFKSVELGHWLVIHKSNLYFSVHVISLGGHICFKTWASNLNLLNPIPGCQAQFDLAIICNWQGSKNIRRKSSLCIIKIKNVVTFNVHT